MMHLVGVGGQNAPKYNMAAGCTAFWTIEATVSGETSTAATFYNVYLYVGLVYKLNFFVFECEWHKFT